VKKGLINRLVAGAAGAALIVGVPSSGLAVGLLQDGASLVSPHGIAGFTPASADPRVARIVAERSNGTTRFMRFTPAGADSGTRSLTVAVRVDEEAARAISVRSAIEAATDARASANAGLRIAPTRYNLGLARGYQSFAKAAPAAAPTLATPIPRADMPDLADFKPSRGVKDEPSRFAARVQMEPEDAAGRAVRLTGPGADPVIDQTLDVAGSYRLTRNLDVTAGVRYSQDRDALVTLPDIEEQDSQAVYIGTQFRF
jgi:hypothetical protein